MAKHMRKGAGWKGGLSLLILVVSLILAASVIVGAVLISNKRQSEVEGNLLPEEFVLPDYQYLIPQELGGFVLLSGDQMETRVALLTRQGAIDEQEDNLLSIPAHLEHFFVKNGALYLISNLEDWESGTSQVFIHRILLDGSGVTPPEENGMFVFDNTEFLLELTTVCVDDAGSFYGIPRSVGTVVCFDPTDVSVAEPVELQSEEVLPMPVEGFAIDGDRVYLGGYDENERANLWYGTLEVQKLEEGSTVRTVTGLERLSQWNDALFVPEFPVRFLENGMLCDRNDELFYWMDLGWSPVANTHFGIRQACVLDNDLVAGITRDNQVDLFAPEDFGTPVSSYECRETVKAIADGGDALAVLLYSEESGYRCVLLREEDFNVGAISSESSSEESSSSGESSELDSSDSQPDSSEETSSEPDLPIHSGLDSSDVTTSEESSEESSELSSASQPEISSEPMAERIESDEFFIDRDSNTVVLPSNTTLARFKRTLTLGGASLAATNQNGNSFTSGTLGTGTRLELYRGAELWDRITVIVKGDLSGNGAVNSADLNLLHQHLVEQASLVGYEYTAADLDGDQSVDTRDLILLKQQLR